MPSVKFYIKSKSNPASLQARISTGTIDAWAKTGILINPDYWDHKNQNLKKSKDYPSGPMINNTLTKLKGHIIDQYNASYIIGDVIDSSWLKLAVLQYFKRPGNGQEDSNNKTYREFVYFCRWWIDNHAKSYRSQKSRRFMPEKSISEHSRFIDRMCDYQKHVGKKILFSDLGRSLSDSLFSFLEFDLIYGASMINKFIFNYHFLCQRAVEHDRPVPDNYYSLYAPKEDLGIISPYLNSDEIRKIFEYDFSDNDRLDNARDNFIIGLNTGLRVSDFLSRLNIENFTDDYISIRTQKTNSLVTIPVHYMVRKTLNKRHGLLPHKISDQKFNKYIKEICEIVGINTMMQGSLMDPVSSRKKTGIYPKHKLISSHVCRRSFATNNFGKISDDDLRKIGGWSSLNMMYKYIKKSSREPAQRLKEIWEKESHLK